MQLIDNCPIKLTILTPLHIGHFQQKTRYRQGRDFVHHNGRVYWINHDRLLDQINGLHETDDFLAAIEGRDFNLSDFVLTGLKLSGNKLSDFLSQASAYSCPAPIQMTGDYHPFIRDGYADPYLPGSSLKGALRSAVIYCFIKHHMQDGIWFEQAVLAPIRNNLRRFGNKRYEVGDFLEKFFSAFKLGDMSAEPHTDLFRSIRVADTPLEQSRIAVNQVEITGMSSKPAYQQGKGSPGLYVECLMPSSSIVLLNIGIDFGLFSELARKPASEPSLGAFLLNDAVKSAGLTKNILKCCSEFSADLLENSNKPPVSGDHLVRLGGRTGVNAKGIMTLIYPHLKDPEKRQLVNLFRHAQITTFPKTGSLVIGPDGTKQEPGWIKLKEDDAP